MADWLRGLETRAPAAIRFDGEPPDRIEHLQGSLMRDPACACLANDVLPGVFVAADSPRIGGESCRWQT